MDEEERESYEDEELERKRSRKSLSGYPSNEEFVNSNSGGIPFQRSQFIEHSTTLKNTASSVSLVANGTIPLDQKLLENDKFPKDLENPFIAAIFEIGLKNSSPKLLIPLLPTSNVDLSTEHIKSHLQKYRVHAKRSREEFELFYRTHVQESFAQWEKDRGWEKILSAIENGSTTSMPGNVPLLTSRNDSNSSFNQLEETNNNSHSNYYSGQEFPECNENPHNLPLDEIQPSYNEVQEQQPQFLSEEATEFESNETTDQDNQDNQDNHGYHPQGTTIPSSSLGYELSSAEIEQRQRIHHLEELRLSLTNTVHSLEEIKGLGKMAADDCSRFSKNLQSMINL
jgi:SHAQKYF class myb-like DNA-binding protein